MAEAGGMPKIQVTEADLATVYRLADGTLSPLTGPMNEEQWNTVLDEKVILSQGERYAWTIPLALPVTDAEAAALKVGGNAALFGPDGELVGVLEVQSLYDWDKAKYIESVYGTTRTDHPGGAIATNDERTKLVGGDIYALSPKSNPAFAHYVLSPRQTRALLAERGYEKALAFQTRNPLHRAHEYALVYGAEQLTRAGQVHRCGAQPPHWSSSRADDVDAATRMEDCYENLDRRSPAAGQGRQRTPTLWGPRRLRPSTTCSTYVGWTSRCSTVARPRR